MHTSEMKILRSIGLTWLNRKIILHVREIGHFTDSIQNLGCWIEMVRSSHSLTLCPFLNIDLLQFSPFLSINLLYATQKKKNQCSKNSSRPSDPGWPTKKTFTHVMDGLCRKKITIFDMGCEDSPVFGKLVELTILKVDFVQGVGGQLDFLAL